jgi:hypothetical protein
MAENNHETDPTILEVTRLIKEFRNTFKAKTSDIEKFLTINELESQWTELKNSTEVLYSDMIRELMAEVDEREMVSKKKENTQPKE